MADIQTKLDFNIRKSSRKTCALDKKEEAIKNGQSEREPIKNGRSEREAIKNDRSERATRSRTKSSLKCAKNDDKLTRTRSKRNSRAKPVIDSHDKNCDSQIELEITPVKDTHNSVLTPSKRKSNMKDTQLHSSPPKLRASEIKNVLSPVKSPNAVIRPVTESPRVRRKLIDKENQENIFTSPTKAACSPKKIIKALAMLSPRKEVQHRLLSPRKTNNSPVKTPSSSHKPDMCNTRKVPSKSPRKSLFSNENESAPPSLKATSPYKSPPQSALSRAKQSLNTQQPENVVCRDAEIKQICDFFSKHLDRRTPGSLYISGAPGTGKTAVLKHTMCSHQGDYHKVFINSMTMKSSLAMYRAIGEEIVGPKGAACRNTREACRLLEKSLTSKGKMILLVLDEMDQLDSKNQEVLYTIFEWPSLPNSRLVLVGIANALDLTDRILPRLQMKIKCRPQLLHFTPYSKDQIITVVNSRLKESKADEVLDKAAIMFCARKVSAVAGDMRKALDICRRSIEVSELSSRKQSILSSKKGLIQPINSPQALPSPKVGIMQVAGIVDQVYGNISSSAQPSMFPLQQKLVICSLLLLLKNSKLKELTLGKVHETYCKVCRRRDVTATDQSEFTSLCELLESRGLLVVRRSKQLRLSKISLKLDAKELEFALQDATLISSVLDSTL